MIKIQDVNIDDETINLVGLRLSDKPINAPLAPDARIFEYPHIENVFVMENDLYGNKMPKDSCFLVFNGSHGLIGKHLKVDTLRNISVDEIRLIVDSNTQG
jgi:hypothetical protein